MTVSMSRAAILASSAAIYIVAAAPIAAQSKSFDIPAQPARSGISDLGRQADIQIAASRKTTEGRRTNPVRGTMSVEQGLRQLLDGTGLVARLTGSRTFTVLAQSSPVRKLSAVVAPPEQASLPVREAPATVEPSPFESGEIIVTAQKRAESVNDVPMSIAAVSGEQLASRGITDTADLAKVVSGFTFNTDARGAVVYTIRGIGFQESTVAASPSVTVYVDEIPLPYALTTLGASLDLDRVEVLKGPQGTLYGQNATGGLVNYIVAKPTNTFSAGGNIRYGRFNTADLSGFVSGPLSDTMRIRVSARSLQADAWQKSYTRTDEIGKKNQLYGRILLDWDATDRLSFSFNVNAWRDRSESPVAQLRLISNQSPDPSRAFPGLAGSPIAPANARAADWTPGYDYRRNNRFYQASLRADYALSDDLNLTSLTSYQDYKLYMPLDNDGSSFRNIYILRTGKIQTWFQELRIGGDLGSRGSWIIGANYQHDNTFESGFLDVSESSQRHLGRTLTNDNEQIVETKAIYGNIDIPVTERVSFNGGIRYTSQDRDYAGCSRDSGSGTTAAVFNALTGVPNNFGPGDCITLITPTSGGLVRSSLDEDNLSWRAGVRFEPNRDLMLYANITRGFKAGSYPTVSASRAGQLAPVVQERVTAYEAGTKATLFDRALQLNGAVFYYDYKDKQIRGRRDVPPFGALEGLVNIPKSHVVGAEVSATIRPYGGLTISPSVSFVKSKIEKPFVNFRADGFPPAVELGGESFPYTPEWTGSSDAEYRWGLNSTLNAFLGGTLTFQSHTYGGFGELANYRLRSYALLDLRAGIESSDRRWTASIWGQNVTNTYYWVAANRLQDAVVRNAGMPVTYGISLGWRY
ncbi:MAG: TonB-dependent receptor [Pseudomonadota bacterium]|jgi:iron complex outermembrane receptor protein